MAITETEILHGRVNPDTPLEYSHEEGAMKIFGFWVFLASDLILFACLFATYTILKTHTAGGPGPANLYDVRGFTEETFILLTSSFTCGLATHEMRKGNRTWMSIWLVITMMLGLAFISLEVNEFVTYVSIGATMQRSAFLSAFFTLVGTHGCHVSLGIVWMLAILIQVIQRGINATTARKIFIVSLYWHFLDVVWVFIFSVVYLPGVM
ncbi:MAG: cytochrome o ubiquinol oxidase subunit [Bacilli bacterium]|nr:cytochrome o ubiquinol oxidase subunit [Bacilli bacterium]